MTCSCHGCPHTVHTSHPALLCAAPPLETSSRQGPKQAGHRAGSTEAKLLTKTDFFSEIPRSHCNKLFLCQVRVLILPPCCSSHHCKENILTDLATLSAGRRPRGTHRTRGAPVGTDLQGPLAPTHWDACHMGRSGSRSRAAPQVEMSSS